MVSGSVHVILSHVEPRDGSGKKSSAAPKTTKSKSQIRRSLSLAQARLGAGPPRSVRSSHVAWVPRIGPQKPILWFFGGDQGVGSLVVAVRAYRGKKRTPQSSIAANATIKKTQMVLGNCRGGEGDCMGEAKIDLCSFLERRLKPLTLGPTRFYTSDGWWESQATPARNRRRSLGCF